VTKAMGDLTAGLLGFEETEEELQLREAIDPSDPLKEDDGATARAVFKSRGPGSERAFALRAGIRVVTCPTTSRSRIHWPGIQRSSWTISTRSEMLSPTSWLGSQRSNYD
jgi:hypothetical protein